MKYVVGASMLVRKEVLDEVGLMNEDYFLYFEEIDWATRAKKRFPLAYAPRSLVYHKEGGSTGTAPQSQLQPAMCDYYATRNRILFTRRFHRLSLPTVLAAVTGSFFYRFARGSPRNGRAVLRGAWDALRGVNGESFLTQSGRE